MKLSVILPVFNVSPYIVQCLNSIVAQCYDDMECIIVDDCGTDDSVMKIEHWLDAYKGDILFTLLHNESNQGLSLSRNRGLAKAKGDYVMFLDSDDYFVDGALVKVMQAVGDSTPDIVRTNYILYKETEESYRYVISSECSSIFEGSGNSFLSYLRSTEFNYVWLNLYKRSFLLGNDLKFINMLYEDFPFSIASYYLASSVTYLQMPLVTYRIRKGSITQIDGDSRFIRNFVSIYESNLLMMHRYNMGDELLPKSRAHFYYARVLVWQYIHHKNVADDEIKTFLHDISDSLHKYYMYFGVREFLESILWSEQIGLWYIKLRRFLTLKKY